jgi:rod shape-determining protein MreB
LPREVIITDVDIREAIASSVRLIVEGIKEVLELTPPEVLSDVAARGIVLVGGGAALHGFAEYLERELRIPVHIAHDALSAVARGTGAVLENTDLYQDVLIWHEDELPPTI